MGHLDRTCRHDNLSFSFNGVLDPILRRELDSCRVGFFQVVVLQHNFLDKGFCEDSKVGSLPTSAL